MIGKVLENFEIPDLAKTGIIIATKAKVILDDKIQDIISQLDKPPNEILSFTKV